MFPCVLPTCPLAISSAPELDEEGEANVISHTNGKNLWRGSVKRNGYLNPGSPYNVLLQTVSEDSIWHTLITQ